MFNLKKQNKKNIYLWTGDGWGKTTSALGVALRALGHNKKVIVIQFMKGRKDKIGEYKIRKRLGKNYQIYQFGSSSWVNLRKPSEKDKQSAQQGLEFTKKILKQKPFLLILDEINLATKIGLLNMQEVIDLLNSVPISTMVYLTGRNAPKELIEIAAYVNEIKSIKSIKSLKGKEGIDY